MARKGWTRIQELGRWRWDCGGQSVEANPEGIARVGEIEPRRWSQWMELVEWVEWGAVQLPDWCNGYIYRIGGIRCGAT